MSELHRIWLVIEDLEHVLAPLKRLGPTRFAARGAEHVDVTGPTNYNPRNLQNTLSIPPLILTHDPARSSPQSVKIS